MKNLNQSDVAKCIGENKSSVEDNYNFLVSIGGNHLYDDINFEQWDYITGENLSYLFNPNHG